MLGNCRCDAMCIDGTMRLFHIRGKMHKKVWIAAGDIILVGLSYYQDDVIFMKRMLILAMIISSLKMCGESTESHKYRDEREHIRQVQCTESHKYGDEREQIRQMHSTESHKYGDEREQIRHVHSIESHKYEDEREQIRQTAADNRQTAADLDRQEQIQTDRA
ncbi:eukaryotic translation initiation factor 1A [Tanacetum coccineum]